MVGAVDVEGLGARGVEGTNVQGRVTTESVDFLVGMVGAGGLVAPAIRAYLLADAGEASAPVGTSYVRRKLVVPVQLGATSDEVGAGEAFPMCSKWAPRRCLIPEHHPH